MVAVDFLELSKIVPETIETLQKRVMILTHVHKHHVIGRRAIAQEVEMSERSVRSELIKLKELNLVSFSSKGVFVTKLGQQLLHQFDMILAYKAPLDDLSTQLMKQFHLKDCIVVKGNSDTSPQVIHQMGKALTDILDRHLPKGKNILSVSGGTTIANVVQSVDEQLSQDRRFTIVPARGGGRGELSIQANTVSYLLAQRVKGENQALFVPEQISQGSLKWLLNDPSIANTIQLLKQSNCLIYSVGNAKIMAERRGALKEEIDIIQREHAVGEALGTFFDANGNVVYRLARLGLGLNDLSSLPCEVLVVGGVKKYEAVSAYMKLAPKNTCLVIDEALAKLVLKEETLET